MFHNTGSRRLKKTLLPRLTGGISRRIRGGEMVINVDKDNPLFAHVSGPKGGEKLVM